MTYVLLESPLVLIVLELAVGLVLLYVAQRIAVPRWILPAFFLLAVGLLAVQHFVVTDAEAIRALTRELAGAVDRADVDTFRGYLHDEFDYRGLNRNRFADLVYQQLQTYGVDEARVGGFEMEIEGDLARVKLTARARIQMDDVGIQPYLGRWRLDFRRDKDTWKLIAATELNGPAAAMPLPPGF